jgi:hypothetical protein
MVGSAHKKTDVTSKIIKKKERYTDKMERDFSLQQIFLTQALMLYGSNG